MRKQPILVLLVLWIGSICLGCAGTTGDLVVEPDDVTGATTYRVNVYALDPGQRVMNEVDGLASSSIEVTDIPSGRWAVLVQALDSRGDTISYYQTQVDIGTGSTAITAGPFTPGLPPPGPAPDPQTVTFTLPAFGADQTATLVTVESPETTTSEATTVTLTTALADLSNRAPRIARPAHRELGGDMPRRCPGPEWLAEDNRRVAQMLSREDKQFLRIQGFAPKFQEIAIGDTFDFYIVTTATTVTCEKLADGTNSLVFAEQVGGTPVIDTAAAQAINDAFGTSNPFRAGSGIYARTREVFGSEWNVNPVGGRDGDEEIVLVVLSSGSIGGAGLFGFFRPADEMPQSEAPTSNEGEILYLNAEHFTGDMYDGLATLAHEFQHMVNYNEKVIRDGAFDGAAEEVTLNEGYSVLCEELNGFSLTSTGGGNNFMYQTVQNYLADPAGQSFFLFGNQLRDYGAGFLFTRYLHDQLGESGIQTLATSPEQGMANILAVTGRTFGSWFQDWVVTNLATDLGGAVPASLQYSNFPLNGSYDIRDIGNTTLGGVTVAETQNPVGDASGSFSLPAWSARYVEFGGGTGADLNISLDALTTVQSNLLFEDPDGQFSSVE